MNYDDLNKKLKELKTEDYIWVIYLGIIILSWYSNSLERKYYIYKNNVDKEKYRRIIILIFTILLIVYIYFFKSAFDDFQSLSASDSKKKKNLRYLSFLASSFILISGVIFLYIAFTDNDLNVELAFN